MTITKTVCDVTGKEEPTIRLLPCGPRLQEFHRGLSFDLSHEGAVEIIRRLCGSGADCVAGDVMVELMKKQPPQRWGSEPIEWQFSRSDYEKHVDGIRKQAARECIEIVAKAMAEMDSMAWNGGQVNRKEYIGQRISKAFGL